MKGYILLSMFTLAFGFPADFGLTSFDVSSFETSTPLHWHTSPMGCFYEGHWYRLGTEITHGQSGNWCYVLFCDLSGEILHGDDFNCMKTVSTTTAATTVPTTTSNLHPIVGK
ncbi:hypothetical protein ACJMK2_032377 [Sinanodonta woodiana]|uniref:Uncharacterized protein n=1 Tax=Sinanodonta woodiana TaxID=1069815 RepID=A0ABD3X5L1_SINWO